jgi:hypothetical protein
MNDDIMLTSTALMEEWNKLHHADHGAGCQKIWASANPVLHHYPRSEQWLAVQREALRLVWEAL